MDCCNRSLNNANQSEINGIIVDTTGITNNQILKYDAAQGIFKNQPDSGASGGNNIYNTSDSLTGNRVVTLSGNTLSFNGAASLNLDPGGTAASLSAADTSIGANGGTLTFPHLNGSTNNSILVTNTTGVITAVVTPTFDSILVGDGTNTDQEIIEINKGLADNYNFNYYAALFGDATLAGIGFDFPQLVGPQQLQCNFVTSGNQASYISSFAKDLLNGEAGLEYGTNDLTTFTGGKKMRHYLDSTTNIAGTTYRNGAAAANTLSFWTLNPANSTATAYNIANSNCTGNVTISNAAFTVIDSASGLFVQNNSIFNGALLFAQSQSGYLRGEAGPGGYAMGSNTATDNVTYADFRLGGFSINETGLRFTKRAAGLEAYLPNISNFPQASPTHVITCDAAGVLSQSTIAQVAPLNNTIYTADDSLTGNRQLNCASNALQIVNSSSFSLTGTGLISFTTTNPSWSISGNAGTVNSDGSGLDIESFASEIHLNANGSNVNFNSSERIVNLVDPLNPQDAATKQYVDNNNVYRGCMILTAPPHNFALTTSPFLFNGPVTITVGSGFSAFGSALRYDGIFNLDYLITLSVSFENVTAATTRTIICNLTLNGGLIPGAETRMTIAFGEIETSSVSIIRSLNNLDTISANIQLASGSGINAECFNFTICASKV